MSEGTDEFDQPSIRPLTRQRAELLAPELLAMLRDQSWDDWTDLNLLADRPQKWARSIVAEDRDGVIGWAIVSKQEHSLHVHHLVVAPGRRNQSVGSQLLMSLLRQTGEQGRLTLKVHQSNSRAIALYSGLGFARSADADGDYLRMERPGMAAPRLRVAVHQPNYLPWGGYFSKMLKSDIFVLLDDAQLPQGRSYVSRTKVARAEGDQWLTVPVTKGGKRRILDVQIADAGFADRHLQLLHHEYSTAPFRHQVLDLIRPALTSGDPSLASMNMSLIASVADYVGWGGRFVRASTLPSDLRSDERIGELVAAVGGKVYISGAGGETYQSASVYNNWGVSLEVHRYEPTPYTRQRRPFVPGLSCVDALMYLGQEAVAAFAIPSQTSSTPPA